MTAPVFISAPQPESIGAGHAAHGSSLDQLGHVTGSSLSFAITAVLSLVWTAIVLWTVVQAIRRRDDGEDGDGGGGDGGGGGEGPVPRPPGADGDFDWWPEFERAFADYVSPRRTRV